MKLLQVSALALLAATLAISACTDDTVTITNGSYTGSGSVTQGSGTTTTANLFSVGIRVAALGTITSTDGLVWTVPADINFTNSNFPTASDLYNSYVSGHSYSNTSNATAALSGSDIINVDASGDVFTAYIFGDNYFEMYVNGIAVGKDPVPYTDFNSCIVRFRAVRPFTVAVKCVDWEENLGLGTEAQGSSSNYIGDGGFITVIKDATGNIVDITNNSWKAQTYYIAPISDLACLTESGNARLSDNCTTAGGASNSYGIHWEVPTNWFETSYDDTAWPAATTFSNSTVGVNNKSSYTNFTDIFDNSANDASFIWSSNLLLDNLVLLRKTVQ